MPARDEDKPKDKDKDKSVPNITLSIPVKGINNICKRHGYAGDEADNAAKAEFARQWIVRMVKADAEAYERDVALASVTITPIDIT